MANRNKKSLRRRKKKTPQPLIWAVVGVVGLAVIGAALALFSRGQAPQPGLQPFDPDFEPEVNGAPRVEVLPEPVVDYGDVKLNTTVNTVYTVRNVGDEPLIILGEPQVELVQGC